MLDSSSYGSMGLQNDAAIPLMSVVIPTEARYEVLKQALTALEAQTVQRLEIIVIDSTVNKDPSATAQLRNCPGIKYVDLAAMTAKRSMQAARNVGLVLATAPIVAFLDDDCIAQTDWAERILEAFGDDSVTAVGGRIVDRRWSVDTPGEAQAGLVGVLKPQGVVRSGFFSVGTDPISVEHLPGGNCAVRKAAALEIGGFDVTYGGTAFMEDTDFFYRLHKSGHHLLFHPLAEVYHLAASKTGHGFSSRTAPKTVMWELRNLAMFRIHVAGVPRAHVALDLCGQVLRRGLGGLVAAVHGMALGFWGVTTGVLSARARSVDGIADAKQLIRQAGLELEG